LAVCLGSLSCWNVNLRPSNASYLLIDEHPIPPYVHEFLTWWSVHTDSPLLVDLQ
jgi:hypothetical protein